MRHSILGIRRSPRFSPNSTDRDEAIFQKVVTELTAKGWQVDCVNEDEFVSADGHVAVFSMARDVSVLQKLAAAEQSGLLVLNSAQSLLRDTRVALTEIFEKGNVPVPHSPVLYQLEGSTMVPRARKAGEVNFPMWLKRSGACAQSAGDVCFVKDQTELDAALSRYAERGIDEVLANEHLQGDLVKFYGVEGTDFFYYHYPTADNAFSKFGLEQINGAPSGYPLDVAHLKQVADHAASFSGISIYGGDCIVDAEGHFKIIDFNDWPSFSRCCAEAAQAIADKIARSVEKTLSVQ